jgi:hypothetical protein
LNNRWHCIDNGRMANRQPDLSFMQRIDVLDVRLLDLFAQVEALLRCGREAQRQAH